MNLPKFNLNIPYIMLLIIVILVLYAVFISFPIKDTSAVFQREIEALEARIADNRKIREEKKMEQEKIYEAWKTQDETLSGAINADKQKLEGLRIYTNTQWTASGSPEVSAPLIPNANANESNESTVRHNSQGSSLNTGEVLPAPQAYGKSVATPREGGWEIQTAQNKPTDGEAKYWKAYEVGMNLIHKHEWLRLTAYWDYKGCSIGYGTRARSCSEKITQAEADRRVAEIVKQLLTTVQKDFPNLSAEGQGALVSFAYNCHSGYVSVRNNGLKHHSQWCSTAWWVRLQGLVNRRAEESRLIFQ